MDYNNDGQINLVTYLSSVILCRTQNKHHTLSTNCQNCCKRNLILKNPCPFWISPGDFKRNFKTKTNQFLNPIITEQMHTPNTRGL